MSTSIRHTLRLEGCTVTPLVNYLKALGVFRIVAEQVDPGATARWEAQSLCLSSSMDREDLLVFFANEYHPTPVIAPWNGGSGFHPGEDRENINKILATSNARFTKYRTVIEMAFESIDVLGLPTHDKDEFKTALKDKKRSLLQFLRNMLPYEALCWIDAAVLLGTDSPQYPPLLGTGGNDGRLEFTNNFMQRLDALFNTATGLPNSHCKALLDCALFDAPVADLPKKKAIGQFHPGAAGGANMTCSFEADAVNNTWDYVLMIEGALMFAAASTKRMSAESQGSLSYPFCVRTSGAAYGSAASSDEESSRAEMWVPLWPQDSTLMELKALLSEGRVQVDRTTAVRGVDFARAIATLGTDMGIQSFQRFGFQERNGLAYLAVDLGHWSVAERHSVHLLTECEVWVERFRRCAKGKNAPAGFLTALHKNDEAVMDACRGDGQLTAVLIALGNIERTIIHSPGTATDNRLSPLSRLSVAWLDASDDGSPEFRLACAVASIRGSGRVGPLRSNMIPCDVTQPWMPYDPGQMSKPHVVWRHGSLVDNLIEVLRRRCMDAERYGLRTLPIFGNCSASSQDIQAFIRGEVDEKHMENLLWGLNAIDWRAEYRMPMQGNETRFDSISPVYALLKLTHATARVDGSIIDSNAPGIPYDSTILAQAAAGRTAATRRAARRLRASGWKPLIDVAAGAPDHIRRCAAAVLFPIGRSDLRRVARTVLRFPATHEAENRTEALSVEI